MAHNADSFAKVQSLMANFVSPLIKAQLVFTRKFGELIKTGRCSESDTTAVGGLIEPTPQNKAACPKPTLDHDTSGACALGNRIKEVCANFESMKDIPQCFTHDDMKSICNHADVQAVIVGQHNGEL